MLNTLSCRVDRLTIHCSVPGVPSAINHSNADQRSADGIDACETNAAASVVVSASCVKLVDTSDCFLAPARHAGRAADGSGVEPDRPIEITKSVFWDGLKIELAQSETVPAQQAASSDSSSSDGGMSSEGSTREIEADGGCPPIDTTERACAAQSHSADGESFYACAGEAAGPPVAQSSDDDPDAFFESPEHLDARNTSSRSPVQLFSGLDGGGWGGKATLELAWAAVSSGGALQRVSVSVEGRGPAAVALHAEQLPCVANTLARLHSAITEQRARAKESQAPVVGLQDLTMSMLDALRPEDGLQDVLAVSAVHGDLCASPRLISCCNAAPCRCLLVCWYQHQAMAAMHILISC